MSKHKPTAADVLSRDSGAMIREMQASGLSLYEIERQTGIQRTNLSRFSRGVRGSNEENFRIISRVWLAFSLSKSKTSKK